MAKLLEALALQWNHIGPWSFRVEAGHCLGIAGPSGVGKSVLLRILADLLPHQGEAEVDGVACSAMPAPTWRRTVRYCAAASGWWADTVAEHYTDIGAAKLNAGKISLTPDLFDKNPAQLSTGERQRMALLRSLENDPGFLLLDEPTSALDAATTAQVEALIAGKMRNGMGVVLVSHDGGQLERLSSSILEMRK